MWWYAFANKEHSKVVGEVVAVMCEEVVRLSSISRELSFRRKVAALLLYMFL